MASTAGSCKCDQLTLGKRTALVIDPLLIADNMAGARIHRARYPLNRMLDAAYSLGCFKWTNSNLEKDLETLDGPQSFCGPFRG